MPPYLEYDPAAIDRTAVYRLLTSVVVPRPIGWASTVSTAGVTNLAPFSFFTVVCVVPPMVSLTIARNPDGSEKHTLRNIRETQEFCINVVTLPVWKQMVDSANGFREDESEFDKTGLTEKAGCEDQGAARGRGTNSSRVQAQPGDRARSQAPPACHRRGRLLPRRLGLYDQ